MREQFSTTRAMYECASHEMCPVCTHSNATRRKGAQKVFERARGERFLRYCAQKVPSSTNSQSEAIDISPWILAHSDVDDPDYYCQALGYVFISPETYLNAISSGAVWVRYIMLHKLE